MKLKLLILSLTIVMNTVAAQESDNDIKFRTNGLFLYKDSTKVDSDNENFSIQSLSFNVMSNIDKHFFALASAELTSSYSNVTLKRTEEVGVREAVIMTRNIKYSQLMFGKFYQGFSFLNKLRPEYRPFVFQTTIQEKNFGEHGLNQEGFSYQYELPSSGYRYIQFQMFNPQNSTAFGEVEEGSLGYLASFGSNITLDKNESIRYILSGTVADKQRTNAGTLYAGAELFYIKANPLAYADTNGHLVHFNYIYTARQKVENGYYNSVSIYYKTNIKRHIYALGYEGIGVFKSNGASTNVVSAQYAYRFSKKTKIRFQYKLEDEKYSKKDNQFGLQMNFSLGDDTAYMSY
jgi:hypothetical protein